MCGLPGDWLRLKSLLQAQGESVSLLALLDTRLNKLPAPEDDAQFLVDFFRIGGVDLSLEHLRQLSPDQQLTYAIKQGKQLNLLPPDLDQVQVLADKMKLYLL